MSRKSELTKSPNSNTRKLSQFAKVQNKAGTLELTITNNAVSPTILPDEGETWETKESERVIPL